MPIKAIIFDADGVLIPPFRFAAYLDKKHSITGAMLHPFFAGDFQKCLVGECDLCDALPAYLSEWGWQGSLDDFLSAWFDAEKGIDTALAEAIQALRRSGYVCCLATNQERHRAQYMREKMGLSSLFDHLFFSCEVGGKKPDTEFYQSVQRRLGVPASSILFWNDSAASVEAARSLGWNAEQYTTFEPFRDRLAALLI
jgi:putative hydrolase of the HAD superfamily